MKPVRALMNRFAADESGATAVEYCMIACFISIAAVAVITQIGTTMQSKYAGIIPGLTR